MRFLQEVSFGNLTTTTTVVGGKSIVSEGVKTFPSTSWFAIDTKLK